MSKQWVHPSGPKYKHVNTVLFIAINTFALWCCLFFFFFFSRHLLNRWMNRSLAFIISIYTLRLQASYESLCLGNVRGLSVIKLSFLLRILRFACKYLWIERRLYVNFYRLSILCICIANLLTWNFDTWNAVFSLYQYK